MRGRLASTAALSVAALCCAAPPAGSQQPAAPPAPPSLQNPAVVISYYSARELPNIVGALGVAGLPPRLPVDYGKHYGTSGAKKARQGPPQPPPPPRKGPTGGKTTIVRWT